MTNSKLEENLMNAWSVNEPVARLTKPELIKTTTAKLIAAKEKMLLTSRHYLKVDQIKTGSKFKPPVKIDPLNETQMAQ
jgi:hypothetical protein